MESEEDTSEGFLELMLTELLSLHEACDKLVRLVAL